MVVAPQDKQDNQRVAVPLELTHLDFIGWDRIGVSAGAAWSFGMVEVAVGYGFIYQGNREVFNSEVRQVQPLTQCQPPFTGPECTVAGQDASPPVVGNGLYQSHIHVGSIAVVTRWGASGK